MSFKSVLNVGGMSIETNFVHLDINQNVDERGRPASLAHGGKITVEFDTPSDNDVISDWMCNPVKTMGGSIIYKRIDQDSTMKMINFENAYCVEYHERFDGTMSASNMVTMITISPEKITIGSVNLDNQWPKK